MLLEAVELHRFMAHERSVVELPARGITLVTGANGSGKSSLIEAVAWGGWGRTLRGSNPWPADTSAGPCVVELRAAAAVVHRERTARKVALRWNLPGDPPAEFETTTKAQAALEVVTGSFEMWRRTHLFTSADAWAFAAATDAQRKVMLEALLGLDMFDVGLERCRGALIAVRGSLSREEPELARARGALEVAQGQVRTLTAAQPQGDGPDVTELRLKLRRLDASLETAAIEATDLTGALRSAREAVDAVGRAQAEGRRLMAGVEKPVCGACGQDVPAAYVAKVRASVQGNVDAAVRVAKEGNDALRAVEAEKAAHDADVARLRVQRDGVLRELSAAEETARQRDTWAGLIDKANAQVEALTGQVSQREVSVAALREQAEDLRLTEGVLGLRGVRAQVLDGALYAVQQVANVWLTRFAGEGVELKLHSSTPLKGGGTADTIAVEVVGFGGPDGYAGASEGEKRRVNVALMLALAEVMRARAGAAAGTLFFDEVFDVLDPDGVDAVVAALHEVAEERPVVVITHNADLAARIGADLHLHASAGKFTRR